MVEFKRHSGPKVGETIEGCNGPDALVRELRRVDPDFCWVRSVHVTEICHDAANQIEALWRDLKLAPVAYAGLLPIFEAARRVNENMTHGGYPASWLHPEDADAIEGLRVAFVKFEQNVREAKADDLVESLKARVSKLEGKLLYIAATEFWADSGLDGWAKVPTDLREFCRSAVAQDGGVDTARAALSKAGE
jgi:hypothetical protein